MRKIILESKLEFLVVCLVLVGAAMPFRAAADVGPKPQVSVEVRLNGAVVSDRTIYAQMLTCNAPEVQASQRCGFEDAACDKFKTLEIPEPAEGCTWRLQGPPMVWGGACPGGRCSFSYFLPERFRLAVAVAGRDALFISNPVTRSSLITSYQLDLAGDGSAHLVETTPFMRRSRLGGVLIALFLSLLIELLLGYGFVRLTRSPRRALLGVLIGNLLSVPALWLVISAVPAQDFFLALILGEIAVVVLEGTIFTVMTRGQMQPALAFIMSLALNFISFVLGAPVLAVLAIVGMIA